MLSHGISTGALFLLVGMIYERRHTFEIKDFGGLATPMPVYAMLFLVVTLSSIGLPLLNGFVGEFLVLMGAFQAKAWWGVLAATGVIWSACYMLWMYQRVFFGSALSDPNRSLADLDLRERASLWPLVAAALLMGVWPLYWLNSMEPAVRSMLGPLLIELAGR
jgi:NADH-quinone oxidoreductase subunit M